MSVWNHVGKKKVGTPFSRIFRQWEGDAAGTQGAVGDKMGEEERRDCPVTSTPVKVR